MCIYLSLLFTRPTETDRSYQTLTTQSGLLSISTMKAFIISILIMLNLYMHVGYCYCCTLYLQK